MQNAWDTGQSIPEEAERHIATCRDCGLFHNNLLKITGELKEELDKQIAGMEDPDLSFLSSPESAKPLQEQRTVRRAVPRSIPWIAAGLFAVLATGAGYKAFQRSQANSFIREENRLFIQEIVDRGFFDIGSDYLSTDSSNWFQASDTLLPLN